jgi:hypothetical protein
VLKAAQFALLQLTIVRTQAITLPVVRGMTDAGKMQLRSPEGKIMTARPGALARLFGVSHNDRFARLLEELAAIGITCAAHFRATDGQDVAGIVEFERTARSSWEYSR